MRKIHSKMKVLEWSQQISHCKSMQIFYDAERKLTPQSEVGSTLNSNSSKLLWLSLLPARMKKIQSKMALEWSHQCYIIHQFLRCSRAARWDLDEIQTHSSFYSCPSYLQECYDLFKFESTRVVTTFLPL